MPIHEGKAFEEWRPAKGYEKMFEVSNTGKVRSCDRTVRQISPQGHEIIRHIKGTELSAVNNGNGYLYVTFSVNGRRKNAYIHRLVAEAFLPNPESKKEVNHIDFDKKNNNAWNLEWTTRKENVNHSKCNMIGVRSFRPNPRTGEHHIGLHCGYYRVVLKTFGVEKMFKNLEDAVCFRNEVLSENGITGY